MAEKPATVTRNALLDVFLPAMREFIRVKFYAHLLEQEGQSSNLTRAEKLEKAAAWHVEVLKCLPKPRREQIRGNLGRAQRAEDQIEIGDLSHIFRERDDLFPDAFRPGGRLHNGLLPLQDTRNESVHQLVETWALTKAIRVLETCRDILNACGTSDTADLANDLDKKFIEDLKAQLASSSLRNDGPRDAQPEDAPNLAEQDEEPRSASSRDATNLAGQDDEPRDGQPEGATSLAGQDGGPPARRTGGGVDLTRLGLYVTALGVLIAVVLLVAFTTRSGNGPLVCGDIGDVELTGPGDPNGTVALDGYCTGADDDELTFSVASSDNDIVSAAVEGDLLTLTAGDGSDGTATITVTATDPDGRSARASLTVTVNPPVVTPPPNRPPDCDDVGDVTVVEGEEQEVFVSCSDDDGDTITLRVSAGRRTDHHSVSPGTASIDGSGTQSFTITGLRSSADAGHVEIEADDGKGGTDMVRFSVVVDVHEDEPTGTEPPPAVPPKIEGGLDCTPSPVAVNASVICEVVLSKSGTPPFTYEWSGGSSANTTGDSYSTSFGSEGSQSVSLRVSNGSGGDDASTTVQVMEAPTISSLGCPSSATENQAVNCSPSVSGTGPFTYRWSSGGSGGSGSSYSPSWSATGRKTVSLTVTNAVGSDDGSTSVVVDEDVRRPEIDSIICESPVATNAGANCRVNLSGGAPDSYSWSDSDGGSGNSASYHPSFSSPGSKIVSLTVRNRADSDNDSTALQVMALPLINSVSCSPSETGTGNSVNCSASVSGTGPLTYTWSGGDWGGSSLSYSPSWSSAGTKIVRLSVNNDVGDDRSSTTVIVVAAPVINSISCAPSPVATNTSVNCTVSLSHGTPPFTYEWRGGSSSNTTGGSYSTSFGSEGSQTISLTVSNAAGSDDASTTVEVMEVPTINSLGCPSSATVNQAINCSPTVDGTGPLTYSWSGGDSSGSSSTYSPSWSTTGNKTVSLTVSNAVHSDSASFTVIVNDDPPDIKINCSPSSANKRDSVTCSVTRNDGGEIDNYSWSADGGSPSSGSSSTYSPSFGTSGSKTVSLTASNSAGSNGDLTSVSVVNRSPERDGGISNVTLDVGGEQTINVSGNFRDPDPNDRLTYDADSDSTRTARVSVSGSSVTVTGRRSGSTTITVTAEDPDNATATQTFTVTVRMEPPNITVSCWPSSIDAGDSVECEVDNNHGGEIATYDWSSDGSPSSGSRSTYEPRFNTAGTYTVSLTARNTGGSNTHTSGSIIVARIRPPEGNISCDPTTSEVGFGTYCYWTQTGGSPATSLEWSGGDSNSSGSSYIARFSSFGWKTVRLDVSNSAGSASASLSIRVVPIPPLSLYARCGSDATSVYWFDRTFGNSQKRHLDITGDEATRIFGRAWWDTIGHMSQSACDIWPTGSRLTGRPPS